MDYIIKNTMTGEYLKSGNIFFEWTKDIYYAKVFKGLAGAKNNLKDIETHCKTMGQYKNKEYYYIDFQNNITPMSKIKIMGIEKKEVEI